ncbi:MAG: L,D-transpeptidase [Xanthobacteraceae bacterium]
MPRPLLTVLALAVAIAATPLSAGSAAAARHRHYVRAKSAEVAPQPAPVIDVTLSAQEQQALQIATQNGDHHFIMIDKALGKIIVFEGGKPVWTGSALTGRSPLDSYTAAILALPESHKFTTEEKITPAGRFTVRRTGDSEEGTVFELVEIHGNGWYLALHHVWTGIPSEHRMQRLTSANGAEEHITFGCINVSTETMRYLLAHFAKNDRPPFYVLPLDQTLTASLLEMGKAEAALTNARKPAHAKSRRVRTVRRRQYDSERYATGEHSYYGSGAY